MDFKTFYFIQFILRIGIVLVGNCAVVFAVDSNQPIGNLHPHYHEYSQIAHQQWLMNRKDAHYSDRLEEILYSKLMGNFIAYEGHSSCSVQRPTNQRFAQYDHIY